MWLFLATEMLFFGPLFLAWIYSRHWNQQGFDAGARQTELIFGTINTMVLVTSSLIYSLGVSSIEAGDTRRLIQCCVGAWLLGPHSCCSNSASNGVTILSGICFPDQISPSTVQTGMERGYFSFSIFSAPRFMGCI